MTEWLLDDFCQPLPDDAKSGRPAGKGTIELAVKARAGAECLPESVMHFLEGKHPVEMTEIGRTPKS
jgi:hypothetical protein